MTTDAVAESQYRAKAARYRIFTGGSPNRERTRGARCRGHSRFAKHRTRLGHSIALTEEGAVRPLGLSRLHRRRADQRQGALT